MLSVPLRTASKFCYDLLRTVTFCCVHPVLLRLTTFFMPAITYHDCRGNFLDSLSYVYTTFPAATASPFDRNVARR